MHIPQRSNVFERWYGQLCNEQIKWWINKSKHFNASVYRRVSFTGYPYRKYHAKKPLLFLMFTQHWTDDMTWLLLSEVEKNSNRLVSLDKREKKEVSTCSLPFQNHPAIQPVVWIIHNWRAIGFLFFHHRNVRWLLSSFKLSMFTNKCYRQVFSK